MLACRTIPGINPVWFIRSKQSSREKIRSYVNVCRGVSLWIFFSSPDWISRARIKVKRIGLCSPAWYFLTDDAQQRKLQVLAHSQLNEKLSLHSPNVLLKAIFAGALRTKILQLSLSTSQAEQRGYFGNLFLLSHWSSTRIDSPEAIPVSTAVSIVSVSKVFCYHAVQTGHHWSGIHPLHARLSAPKPFNYDKT